MTSADFGYRMWNHCIVCWGVLTVCVVQVKEPGRTDEVLDLSDYERCEEIRKNKSRSKKNHSKFRLQRSNTAGNMVHQHVCLQACLSLHSSVCPSLHLSDHPSVCLSAHLSVCPSTLSTCLSVHHCWSSLFYVWFRQQEVMKFTAD